MIKFLLIIFILILSFFFIKILTTNISKNQKYLFKLNYIFIACLFLFILLFYFFSENNTDQVYSPPKFDGKVVIPGTFSDIEK